MDKLDGFQNYRSRKATLYVKIGSLGIIALTIIVPLVWSAIVLGIFQNIGFNEFGSDKETLYLLFPFVFSLYLNFSHLLQLSIGKGELKNTQIMFKLQIR